MSHVTPRSDDTTTDRTPKISGANALALLLNLRADHIRPLLAQHGLAEIEPDRWYDQQRVVSVFAAMAALPNITYEDFVAVGMKAIETAQLPPDIPDVESALSILPHAYQLNHRNIPADEGYSVRKISPTHYQFAANSPYPVYVVYGVVYGMVRRYSEGKSQFQVALRSEAPLLIDILW